MKRIYLWSFVGAILAAGWGESFAKDVGDGRNPDAFLAHAGEEGLWAADYSGRILDFYRAWMALSMEDSADSLLREFLTEGMRKKMRRVTGVTDADALYRAQDTSDYMVRSLACRKVER